MTTEPRTILVVDRDEEMAQLIAGALEHAGYRVQQVAGHAAALAAWRVAAPDLILIDVQMPQMSGQELLLSAHQAGLAPVPTILMTAARPSALRAWGRDVRRYLIKPFEMAELLACITSVLNAWGE